MIFYAEMVLQPSSLLHQLNIARSSLKLLANNSLLQPPEGVRPIISSPMWLIDLPDQLKIQLGEPLPHQQLNLVPAHLTTKQSSF